MTLFSECHLESAPGTASCKRPDWTFARRWLYLRSSTASPVETQREKAQRLRPCDFAVVAAQCCPAPVISPSKLWHISTATAPQQHPRWCRRVTAYAVSSGGRIEAGYGESAASRTLSAEHGVFIESILTWNDWMLQRPPSQPRFPESAASLDAAKTPRVPAATGTLLGRHPSSLPARTSTSARSREAPRSRLHSTRTNTTPTERRLTHLQLVSDTHTTSRSRLLSAPARPRLGSASRLAYIARWESLELSLAHVVAWMLDARCYATPTHPAFSAQMRIRASALTTTPSVLLSLVTPPRFLRFPARSPLISPPRPPAYPHRLNSHAAPGAAPSTRVLLALKTATLRPRF
ncbi:hypothetical protein C8F04DRAFT_1263390 [Mycena alexandri]|uniref:Uncharacterized protein n=1 Tax=Mycena alexandri TaxID=1745969 RepID=A0AAD6SNT9_9AGAR|nr:hypothetical protein C8F04DRAFT_1263390 [Mycena alexandri]